MVVLRERRPPGVFCARYSVHVVAVADSDHFVTFCPVPVTEGAKRLLICNS